MAKRIMTIALAVGALGIVSAAQVATSSIASAQPWQESTYSSERDANGKPKIPARSFEGFWGGSDYCSFRREPWRKCANDANGVSQCRTVGWRTIDVCY
jgi:hypothetical protein